MYCGKVRGTPVALKVRCGTTEWREPVTSDFATLQTVRSFEDALSHTANNRRDEKTVANLRNKINKQLEVLKAEQAVVRQVYNPYICLYLVRARVRLCVFVRLTLRAGRDPRRAQQSRTGIGTHDDRLESLHGEELPQPAVALRLHVHCALHRTGHVVDRQHGRARRSEAVQRLIGRA